MVKTEEKTVSMIIKKMPNDLNELLLDKVASERKRGVKTKKEILIINMIKKHRKELS